ncbi:MAG: tRNA pseudouridine(55) synthase TruB [Clostridium sp.]
MNGILNILKPPGMTSHDVVSYVRRTLKMKKVGHTGTLDPGAAGVLPICLGQGTKIAQYLTDQSKEYICELTLGNETDTYDKYGEFLHEDFSDYSHVTYDMFMDKLNNFKGEITQIPPKYSAIKINGKRAYDLAREGEEFVVPTRKVTIHSVEVLDFALPRISLKIKCSKGTYIRSICKDLGDMLGCYGYMSFLLRSQTGPFTIESAVNLKDISLENIENILYPIEYGLEMDSVFIDNKHRDKVLNGNPVKITLDSPIKEGEKVKGFLMPNTFLGIGHVKGSTFKIDKLMF